MNMIRLALLAVLLATSGCSTGQSTVAADANVNATQPTNQQTTRPADWFSPSNPELNKYHKAEMNPAITEDVVKQRVREKVSQGTLTDIQVALKTAQWIADNLSYQQMMFTPDSPVWYVTIKGDIPAPDPEVRLRYKAGKFAVDTEFGQVIHTQLTEPEKVQSLTTRKN